MTHLLLWIARLTGALGVLVCALALGARLVGVWTVASIQIGTLLQLGMAAMVLACLAYCAVLAERRAG